MFETFHKLKYGARVLLALNGGREETIDVAGKSVVLRHGGDPSDHPPFVYLHSTLGEGFTWFPFYQAWARDFHVYVPTHPGFGRSGGFDRIDSIEDYAFHYIELFDALGIERAILGGVSLGGWIAAEFAVRWPERVAKLWIADAPGLWVEDALFPDLFRVMRDPAQARQLLFFHPQSPTAHLVMPDNPNEDRQLMGFQNLTALARVIWDRPYSPKLAGRLHRIACPTLLLWGEHDQLVPTGHARAYRECLPHAELRFIPECGHLPMFEKEREFVAAIAEFAAR